MPGLRVQVGDARAGVAAERPRSFDAVVTDVFVGPYVPEHVMTLQALADVRRALRPGGVYIANLIDERRCGGCAASWPRSRRRSGRRR